MAEIIVRFCVGERLAMRATYEASKGVETDERYRACAVSLVGYNSSLAIIDLSSHPQPRVEHDPTSISLESDVPRRSPNSLERAWWTAAKPANRVRALDSACLYQNYDCAKILLEAEAKAISHLTLSFSSQAQRADMLQLLLEHGTPFGTGSDIGIWSNDMEWRTGFGSNPLHQAVIVGSPTIFDMLLRYGADPNIRIEGVSSLDLAKSKRKLELLRQHTDAGACSKKMLTPSMGEIMVPSYNHILFGNILQHLTTQERLYLYFRLQREGAVNERRRRDVMTLLMGGAG